MKKGLLIGLAIVAWSGLCFYGGNVWTQRGVAVEKSQQVAADNKQSADNAQAAMSVQEEQSGKDVARDGFFSWTDTAVVDFYNKRRAQEPGFPVAEPKARNPPKDDTHEPIPALSERSVDQPVFDADELRLWNQGNKRADFSQREIP